METIHDDIKLGDITQASLVAGMTGHGKTRAMDAQLAKANDWRYSIQVIDDWKVCFPASLPIRVVIDQVEMLTDVIDGLDAAVEHTPGDTIRFLKAREQLVELMDRAIHHESDLEVRHTELLNAARAEIAQTGDVTKDGPLVHLRHALAKHGQLPPPGATPAQLLAQAVAQ